MAELTLKHDFFEWLLADKSRKDNIMVCLIIGGCGVM